MTKHFPSPNPPPPPPPFDILCRSHNISHVIPTLKLDTKYSGPSPVFKELAELPVLNSAQFLRSDATTTVVRGNYTVCDHDHKTKHFVTKTFTLSRPELAPITFEPVLSTTTTHAPDVRVSAVSRSGKHHAIFKESVDGNKHTTRRVEIWSDLRLVASLNVSKVHGPFLANGVFQSISFSPSETAIIYSAEASPETSDDPHGDPYPQHKFEPHFGESYCDTRRPTLVMVRWRNPADASSITKAPLNDTSATVISLPPSLSGSIVLGQAIFATEDRIFATGFKKSEDGRFLGIKWCLNRPSSIWELNTATGAMSDDSPKTVDTCSAAEIKVAGRSCRSPRVLFDRDGTPKQLFWLSNPVGGVHSSSTSLHVRDLIGHSGDRILVNSVSDPGSGEFPGLYSEPALLLDPFIYNTTPSVVLQTTWGSTATIVSVNIETGAVTNERLRFGGSPLDAWTVLATDGRSQMVCSQSSLASPPKLVLLAMSREGEWVSKLLENSVVSSQVQEALDDLVLSVIPIPDRYPAETIVLQSKKASTTASQKPYCITFPHGGPHAVYTTGFMPLATALALEGYTISMPNYTGTLGFGDKYIQKLVGQIGTLDIADCMASVEELVKRGISDRERQLVFGGSHGGFITGNLIGQYPDVFKAAVMINPVTSLGEFSASDLPDFPFVEVGLPFVPSAGVTPETYKKLYDASPVAHVSKVRTPVLFILGESDLRVPPTQGKSYFHALKARGIPVDILTFPGEGHAFEGVEAQRVTFESIRDWFGTHTRAGLDDV